MTFWIPEVVSDGRYRLQATTAGCVGPRGHQMFMGGVSVAAAIHAAEQQTGRPAVWASAQFLGRTMDGDVVDIEVDERPGRTISQATVTLRTADRETCIVRAALGRGDRDDVSVQFSEMPAAAPPERCEPKEGGPWASEDNLLGRVERRTAREDAGVGVEDMWIRLDERASAGSAAPLAIVAEFMPGAHLDTRGGSGLDLTIRFVGGRHDGWILAATRVHALAAGLFHSEMQMFSPEGILLAVASQTGRMPMSSQ